MKILVCQKNDDIKRKNFGKNAKNYFSKNFDLIIGYVELSIQK